MKMSTWICLAVEAALVLIMAFLGDYRALQQNNLYLQQILWRLALAAPVLYIVFESAFLKPARYKAVLAATLVLILAADITLIFMFEAGLAVFLLAHSLNIINFTMLSRKISLKIIIFAAAAVASFLLYKATLEPHMRDGMMKIILQVYMLIILTSFWRALETAGTSGAAFTALLSAGTLVFFIGDYFVARDVYLGEKYHQIVNNLLYYVPQSLLALSAVFYGREPRKIGLHY